MEKILLFEDFTKLYGRWKGGDKRKEDNAVRDFISKQKHPTEFSVTDEGIVNSNIDVEITQDNLINNKLPFKFGYVAGSFRIMNTQINSLEGVPENVGEDFEIWNCPKLESLEYSPKKVGVSYTLFKVGITDMKGCTPEIGGSLKIERCEKLKSLIGSPEKINVDVNVLECKEFDSLEGTPKEIGGDFNVIDCKKLFFESDLPEGCIIKGKKTTSAF